MITQSVEIAGCGIMQAARYHVYRLQQEASCRYRSGYLLVMLQGELVVGYGESVFVYVWVGKWVTRKGLVSI
jgi:hypothetical protein